MASNGNSLPLHIAFQRMVVVQSFVAADDNVGVKQAKAEFTMRLLSCKISIDEHVNPPCDR
jgi:hypothetical protein